MLSFYSITGSLCRTIDISFAKGHSVKTIRDELLHCSHSFSKTPFIPRTRRNLAHPRVRYSASIHYYVYILNINQTYSLASLQTRQLSTTPEKNVPPNAEQKQNPIDSAGQVNLGESIPKESNVSTMSTSDNDVSPQTSAAARAAASLSSATSHYTYEFNKLFTDVEKSVMSKIIESNRQRIFYIVTFLFVCFGFLYFLFGKSIKKGISSGTADIAKETLENESLKVQTQELAMAVVQTILNDKEITSHAAGFLREASNVPETRAALLQLTLHVLQHPESLREVEILLKKVLQSLANDKEAIDYVVHIIREVIKDPTFMKTLIAVLNDLSVHPEVIRIGSELVQAVIARPEVIKAFSDLLSESSKDVLTDEAVISQSREFVADVLGDDKIQREGGDALYNSIAHALRPGLRKLGGVALVGLSIGLMQLLLSPY